MTTTTDSHPVAQPTEREARATLEAWRERIWGDSPEGREQLLTHDGVVYLVTEGTGDGVYAYAVTYVAEWLEDDARPAYVVTWTDDHGGTEYPGCSAREATCATREEAEEAVASLVETGEWAEDELRIEEHDRHEWAAHLAGEQEPDVGAYQRFVDWVSAETHDDLVLAAWRELGLALCEGGSEIISRDDLPAACATDEEIEAAVAEELEIDRERVTVERDVDAYGNDCWTATVDVHEGDRVEGGEPGTEDHDYGVVHELDPRGNARVGWDSGVGTTQPLSVLRIEGCHPDGLELDLHHGQVGVELRLR